MIKRQIIWICLSLIILVGCEKINFEEEMTEKQLKNIYRVQVDLYNPDDVNTLDIDLFNYNDVNSTSTVRVGKTYDISTSIIEPLPNNYCYDIYYIDNTIYVGTLGGGIWIFDTLTNTAKKYDTATIITGGDMLQNNVCYGVYYSNNKIYVATEAGVWIYNEITGIGKRYLASTVVIGDKLPSDDCRDIYVDNNNIYVATGGGIWIFNEITLTGTAITTLTSISGDDLPSDMCSCIYYSNNNIYVATNDAGIWIYNTTTNIGKTYTTTTNVTGDKLPNVQCYSIYELHNKIYVGTAAGIWIYSINTSTGKTYTTSTTVTGDNLPNNLCYRIFSLNKKIYVATGGGIWIFNEITLTGEAYTTSTTVTGDNLPSNICYSIYQSDNKIFVGTFNAGLWIYDDDIAVSNSSSLYTKILNSLGSASYQFYKLRVILPSNFSQQIYEKLIPKTNTPLGQTESFYVNPDDFIIPDRYINSVDVDFNFIIDSNNYFTYSVLPNTRVSLIFYYNKVVDATNILHGGDLKENVLDVNSNIDFDNSSLEKSLDENIDYSDVVEVKNIKTVNENALTGKNILAFLVIAGTIYVAYKIITKK
jgi:hypothetical protein